MVSGFSSERLSCESRFGQLKKVNRRFEAIRANRSHVMKIGCFSVNLRESPRFALRIAGPRLGFSWPNSACGGARSFYVLNTTQKVYVDHLICVVSQETRHTSFVQDVGKGALSLRGGSLFWKAPCPPFACPKNYRTKRQP